MNELKTLKDLKLNWRIEDPIREEAIKHIKHILGFSKITEFDKGAINILKVFFNITEEDLENDVWLEKLKGGKRDGERRNL